MKITPYKNSLLSKILCQYGKLRNQSKKKKKLHIPKQPANCRQEDTAANIPVKMENSYDFRVLNKQEVN